MQNPAEPVAFSRLRDSNSCTVALGGKKLRLRERPTVEWLSALADQDLHLIMPSMLRNRDLHWYMSQLADPRCAFDLSDSHKVTHAVIGEVCKVPWWAAVRLANALGRSWFLADPAALLRSVDLLQVPVWRALSVVYFFAAESCKDEKDRAVLDADLFRPPDGYAPVFSAQQQAASFAAFRQANAAFSRGQPRRT